MNLRKYDIVYDKAIERWDEALPLGNGKLGCLMYGKGPLRMAIDRVELWDTRPNPATLEKGFTYANLIKLFKSGDEADFKEYRRLFDDVYSEFAYPTKLTAGRMELDFGVETEEISSRVDIQQAIANVQIEGGRVANIEAFMSATHFVGVAKIYGNYELDLHIPEYVSGDENGECDNRSGIGEREKDGCLHYPHAKVKKEKTYGGEFVYYEQETRTDFRYGVVVFKKQLKNYSELYFTIATNKAGEDFIQSAKKELKGASLIGYEILKAEHVAWWKKYWQKSEISVKDHLIEKTYYRSWYLFASCSRKGFYPMPLQGVWTADNDSLPPWKGDYHHDTNTQLSYQAFLKANRMEEGVVFVDYLWSLKEEFTRFAKNFYGVDGLLIPGVSTIDGKAMGGWAQYALSPTMSIWSAQSFDEYYLYTGDKKFLEEKAFPFLAGIGEAIYGLMEEKNGKLYLPLSTSPEIFDDKREAYLEPNSNFDLALLKYLYKTLLSYTEILGKDGSRYEDILNKLDDFALKNGKYLMLDKTHDLEQSHRHFSHLMALYPLHLINYDTEKNKMLYWDCIYRLENYGTGAWVGFSFGMAAQIYAMAQSGNGAYEKLRQFAKAFVAENGFHLNGDFKNYGLSLFHYRPFTLESSFAYCDALQEMFLQEHQGYVHVFPAIPDDWLDRKISFKKLRTYQSVLVSASSEGGRVESFEIFAENETTIKIKNTFGKETLAFSNGQTVVCPQNEIFELSIQGKVKLL